MSIKKRPARRKRPLRWELRVYVANQAARSVMTIANLERLCQQYLPGRYRIDVVDLLLSPERCREDEILAVPTVVRHLPLPARRAIGTLADAERAAEALEMSNVN